MEKLTAFPELESAIRGSGSQLNDQPRQPDADQRDCNLLAALRITKANATDAKLFSRRKLLRFL
jgi:hypothetical protein